MRKVLFTTALAAALAVPASAQSHHMHEDAPFSPQEVGAEFMVMEVSADAEARALFLRGLALLHNFEYSFAAEEFRQAQEADPAFVMAYWGEAMTYNHPLWRAQDYDKGTAALSKLADTKEARASLALSELEGDLLESVEILYGEGEKFDRDKAYHQGTIWPWLMGPYAEAVLRLGKFSDAAKTEARQAIEPLLEELEELTRMIASSLLTLKEKRDN